MPISRRRLLRYGLALPSLRLAAACRSLQAQSSNTADNMSAGATSTGLVHNLRYANLPVNVAMAATSQDFAADALAVKQQLQELLNQPGTTRLRMRGGGHSYIGASVASGGQVLNLAPLKTMAVDLSQGTLRFGAGCSLADVAATLSTSAAGFYMPVGDCPSVGAVGFTLGGGSRSLSPQLGLSADCVVAATVVTMTMQAGSYQAEVRQVSQTQEPELFWAILGGGGAFGVVTDLTCRVGRLDDSFVYKMLHKSASPETFRDFFVDWLQLSAQELSQALSGKLQYGNYDNIYLAGVGQQATGDQAKLQALASRHGLDLTTQPLSFASMEETLANCSASELSHCATEAASAPPQYLAAKSTFLSRTWQPDADQILAVARRVKANHADYAYVQFTRWSGAMAQINPNISFPWRDFAYECEVAAQTPHLTAWAQPEDYDPWVDQVTDLLGERHAAYFNHANVEVAAKPDLYFGPVWPRLQGAKATYDPAGVFNVRLAADAKA